MTDLGRPPGGADTLIPLLPDVPARLDARPEADVFAHQSYVDVLARALRAGTQPLTLGLLGPWGVGKSTVLKALAQKLKSKDCAFVIFDAWRYDADTMRRQLLRDVAAQLKEQGALSWRFRVRRRLAELDVDQQTTSVRVRPSLGGLGTAAFQAGVAAGGIALALQNDTVSDALASQTAASGRVLSLVLGLITFLASAAGQFLRPLPVVRTLRRAEDPDRFHALFRDLVSHTRTRQLVIAIDNLDRCPPDVALELLSTIKTYLEPASEFVIGTDVLFLLAVDDKALVHQIRSAAGADGEAFAPEEYLRKVFTATVRMTPLHREDLRTFALNCLERARPGLGIELVTERELATLMDAALRETPRKVIQFVNNFLLRLEMIRARERGEARAIDEPLSDNVLMLAKLALIEECWPDLYRRLEEEPQRLGEWDGQARDVGPALLDERFAAFLRVSSTIRVDDVRPYLALRQAPEEHGLAQYGTFRAAVTTGDRDAAARILDAAGKGAQAYINRLDDIYDEERRSSFFVAARSVVDFALADHRIGPLHPISQDLVGQMLDDPRSRGELKALPAARLLQTASLLDERRQHVALSSVIERLASADAAGAVEGAEALVEHHEHVTPVLAGQIALRTANEPFVRHIDAMAIVLRAKPEWIDTTTADMLALRLEQDTSLLSGDEGDAAAAMFCLLVDAPASRIARARIAVGLARFASLTAVDSAIRVRVVAIARHLLAAGTGVPELIAAWAKEIETGGSNTSLATLTWPLLIADASAPEHVRSWVNVLLDDAWPIVQSTEPELLPAARAATQAALVDIMVQRPSGPHTKEHFDRLRAVAFDYSEAALRVALQWAQQGRSCQSVLSAIEQADVSLTDTSDVETVAVGVAASMSDMSEALPWLAVAARERPVSPHVERGVLAEIERLGMGAAPTKAIMTGLIEITGRLTSSGPPAFDRIAEHALIRLPDLPADVQVSLYEGMFAARRLLSREMRLRLRREALELWVASTDRRPAWESFLVDLGLPGDVQELADLQLDVLEAERSSVSDDYDTRVALLSLGLRLAPDGASSLVAQRLFELKHSKDIHDQRVAARL